MSLLATDNRIVMSQPPAREEVEQMVQRVHEIGPLLREQAEVADRQRLLPQASVEALEQIGAWDISTLKRYGGYEGGAQMLFEVARTIGYYDPSAAWCVVISNGSVMLTNRYEDAVLDEVFANGPIRSASILLSLKELRCLMDRGGALKENGLLLRIVIIHIGH